MKIVKYEDKYQNRWDTFLEKNSRNGTFLQSRRFLNYHSDGKFNDASIMIMQSSQIVAVIPACDVQEEGKRCFFSHKGSTFGGLVIDNVKYNISAFEEIFLCLEEYLIQEGFETVLMKETPEIFVKGNSNLLDYYYFKHGYEQLIELSFYINCSKLPEDITRVFSSSRRRDYKYSLKNNLKFCCLESDEQIKDFYFVLCKNLKKFNVMPVHSLQELLEFKNQRLSAEVEFYGVYLLDRLIAGSMVFCFGKKVLHTQYLAQDTDYSDLYTMNFLNYNLINLARNRGFLIFSFGTSTHDKGRVLNKGLALFKEGFGAEYGMNRSYKKNLK